MISVLGITLVVCLASGCNRSDESPGSSATSAPSGQTAPPETSNSSVASSNAPAQPVPPKPSGPPLGPIESLVAPVALYPDPLLSELLIAATYPVEIVQAARWLEANPDLGTLKDKDWDPSVQRIVQVPDVLKMMNQHLDWTTALGNAFLENPDAVLSAVQTLRGKAMATGFLKDTPQQKVDKKIVKLPAPRAEPAAGAAGGVPPVQVTPAVVTREVVAIQPAKQDTLYFPQYSPEAAYSAPLAPPPGSAAPVPAATTATYPAQPAYYPGYAPVNQPMAEFRCRRPGRRTRDLGHHGTRG
jgi:hypothetical protein